MQYPDNLVNTEPHARAFDELNKSEAVGRVVNYVASEYDMYQVCSSLMTCLCLFRSCVSDVGP